MEETKLKELLKEAFNKGRDYQYDINPYSGKLKENSKALTFTKWYNQVKNINVIPCCESDSEQLTDKIERPKFPKNRIINNTSPSARKKKG